MVCEMQISDKGIIEGYQFYEAVMHSHARMTYTQVAQIVSEQNQQEESAVRQQFSAILPQVDALQGLAQQLQKRRSQRGAIDFDTQETRILFDSKRKISQIIPVDRTDAHRLIEECMLCANLCAAEFLQKSKLPALYRVHEGPSEERLISVRDFLGELGIGLGGGDDPMPMHYRQVLNGVKHRDDAQIIQSVLLRSMSQAVYQCENLGHFGLAFDAYTHFTSPIRRYSDLLVHRAIRSLIKSGKKSPHIRRPNDSLADDRQVYYPYELGSLEEVGQHLSVTERRADEATRDVVNWLKCEFLMDRVSEQYTGVVSAVTGFGLFVMLDELMVEGLIHVTGLPKDYYHHEATQHRMVGERTGRVFRLGQKVRVQVVRVNLEERKIDFELIDTGSKETQNPKAKSTKKQHDDRPKKNRAKKSPKSRRKPEGNTNKAGAKRKRKSRR
jgi:ribonuclease R